MLEGPKRLRPKSLRPKEGQLSDTAHPTLMYLEVAPGTVEGGGGVSLLLEQDPRVDHPDWDFRICPYSQILRRVVRRVAYNVNLQKLHVQ